MSRVKECRSYGCLCGRTAQFASRPRPRHSGESVLGIDRIRLIVTAKTTNFVLPFKWRDDVACPVEEDYIKMVVDKTGGLFRLAVGLMQAFATENKSTDFAPLVNNLALYFQIRDDYINLADEEYMKSKSFCEDFTEGKFSFPVIHCIKSDSQDTRILSILKKRTEDIDVKRYAQRVLLEKGSLTYTLQKCRHLKTQILEQIAELGGNEQLVKLVELLNLQLDGIEATAVPRKLPTVDEA